jgi:hypothetical protein
MTEDAMTPEVQNYLHMIEDLRGQVGRLIVDLPAEALNWRPIEGSDDHATNSLAVMAAHVAGGERFWIAEIVGRRPVTRDRNAEFVVEVTGPAELLERLEKTGVETRNVLSTLVPADLDGFREIKDKTVSVRWAILHIIDHTALHLGHMQLTYQLWHGGQAGPSPRWFQRLPENR